jgi:DNA polymerase-1
MAGIVGFDIETASAELLFRGGYEGSFVRLVGWVIDDGEPQISTDPQDLLDVLKEAKIIYGHNVLGYDLIALAVHAGADYHELAAKSIDTLVGERTINPPFPKLRPGVPLDFKALRSKGMEAADLRISYRLNDVAVRYGLEGKTDHLPRMAAEYGGYDKIPQFLPEYWEYLRGDLYASRGVYRELGRRSHKKGLIAPVKREMQIAAIQNGMYLKGMAADREQVEVQVEAARVQREEAYAFLHEAAGVPLSHSEVKWQERVEVRIPRTTRHGKRVRGLYEHLFKAPCPDLRTGYKWRTKVIGASPLTTTEGRSAFETALRAAGVRGPDVPFTPNGALALSKHALGRSAWLRGKESVPGLMQKYPDNVAVVALCEAAIKVTSANAKAEEVLENICPDGRVHPRIGDIQASGRWAHIGPSVTNIGKRGPALQQRRMFRAKKGYVFIAIDLDQVDARAIAGWCQDPKYRKLARPGEDMHYGVALRVYGAGSCEDCRNCDECAERRGHTKAITHAWNYGQGPKGAAALTGLPLEVTTRFDRGMKKAFPVLCSWRDRIRKQAIRTGLVPSKWGRVLRVIPGQEYTQAPAQIGQATTRDLLCDGLLKMDREVLEMLCLVIHDEIVLEVPEDRVEEIGNRAMAALTSKFEGVAITCGISPASNNWIGCYEKAA